MKDDDRNAILKRRTRLIQSALVAAGLSIAAPACDDSKPAPEEDVTRTDTASQDTQPEICLGVPADTSEDTGAGVDTQPEVCLEPPVDIIEDTSQPEVCLSDTSFDDDSAG